MDSFNETPLTIDLKEFLDDLPHLSSTATYWLIRANKGDFYTDFFMNQYVGIGWNEITLDEIQNAGGSVDAMKNLIVQNHPNLLDDGGAIRSDADRQMNSLVTFDQSDFQDFPDSSSSVALSSMASQLLRFGSQLRVGDTVVVPNAGSNLFIIGVISSTPFEVPTTENPFSEASDYKKSGYTKRIKVKWLGRFARENADPALYKMIFSQHTISIVNDYAQFINRAVFDAYVLDDAELHLTYHITADTDIHAGPLGQFLYQLSSLNYLISGTASDLRVKINVQSPGPAESTTKKLMAGAITFAIIFGSISIGYGGGNFSVKDGKVIFSTNGLAKSVRENTEQEFSQKQQDESAQEKTDSMLIENEEKAFKLAKETGVPISELGIELPERATKALQKQIDEWHTKQKNNPTDKNGRKNLNSNINSEEQKGDQDSGNGGNRN